MVLSTLTDLPNELLFAIFQDLDDSSVFQVGKICRRLNEVAIPFMLAREGLTDPGVYSVLKPYHEGYHDSLSALTVYFSIRSVDNLCCILDDEAIDDYSATILSLTRSVERINNLVARLTFVNTFQIAFFKADSSWSLDSEDVRVFLGAFFHLLETLTKKSCKSFKILHPHPIAFNSGYVFQSRPIKSKRFRIVDSLLPQSHNDIQLLQGDGWQYRLKRELNPLYLIPFPPIKSNITNLDIISDFLFVPPFSKWTFHLMRNSPITSLSISIHRFIGKDEFSLCILPKIVDSVPKLQGIKLAFPSDDFMNTLIRNISRLPLLQRITTGLLFYPNMTRSDSNSGKNIPFTLSHLTSFTGSPEQGVILLEEMICPKLHSMNFIIDISLRGKFDYSIDANAFSKLARRFDTLKIRPRIKVCLATCGGRPFGNNPDEAPKPNWIEHFLSVSRLTLEMPRFFPDDNETTYQIDYTLEWLSVFQRIKGLTLTTQRPARDIAARELRDMALKNAITTKFPEITHFNVTEVPIGAHYHWSNVTDELARVARVTSDITPSPNTSALSSICYDFWVVRGDLMTLWFILTKKILFFSSSSASPSTESVYSQVIYMELSTRLACLSILSYLSFTHSIWQDF